MENKQNERKLWGEWAFVAVLVVGGVLVGLVVGLAALFVVRMRRKKEDYEVVVE